MEQITISNFAGLQQVTIRSAPITVLIGSQATGKSVVAKLFYFFREIGSKLPNAVIQGSSQNNYREESKKRFYRYFPPDTWGTANFSITYQCEQQKIEAIRSSNGGTETIDLRWSDFYGTILDEFLQKRQKLLALSAETESDNKSLAEMDLDDELNSKLDEALGPWARFEQLFIPAGRSFFSQVQANVFSALDSGQTLDAFLVAFGALLERSKEVLKARGVFDEQMSRPREWPATRQKFADILGAKFIRRDKQDFFECPDGRRVRLAHASSGQQEALPLLLILGRFKNLRHTRGRAVYIEEPEAHLFPTTQRKIVELMAETFRARHEEMCIFVTTHSPYVLTALNNLLQAGERYKTLEQDEASKKKLEEIIPESFVLNSEEVIAYVLENGEAHSIISPDTKLIDASIIDSVSTDIAIQFDRLLWDV